MTRVKKEIEGLVFNNLKVIKDLGTRKYGLNYHRFVLCECVCGNVKEIFYSSVKRGATKSCGCLRGTHGMIRNPLYKVWAGIKGRCYLETHASYKDYGGRGVTMCDEWKNDFVSFYNWCISNGWKKGLEVDKDIKGGLIYSPENCVLVTHKKNGNNKRNCHFIEFNGVRKSLTEWADYYNINPVTLHRRLFRAKIPFEIAITLTKNYKKW